MLNFIRNQAITLPVLLFLGYFNSTFKKPSQLQDKFVSPKIFTIPAETKDTTTGSDKNDNYSSVDLNTCGLSKEAYQYALKGYVYLSKRNLLKKKNLITIIDFSKPATEKRLYVIDMIAGKVLFNTLVAHGHNSGIEYATQFSNRGNSHQSSLGFYVTMGTYNGDNGYSLKLKGCERGFNDLAYKRKIVLHGAEYVSNDFINDNGFLGRSFGCPAVPIGVHKKIIDCIKGGSCLFIYHPTKKYLTRSRLINS